MAEGVPAVTDVTFEEEVLRSGVPVLVDFTAAWCPPCRMIEPVLAELARETPAGLLKVVQLDVDENPEVRGRYSVMSMPTLMVFRDGEPVKAMVGARPRRRLVKELAEADVLVERVG